MTFQLVDLLMQRPLSYKVWPLGLGHVAQQVHTCNVGVRGAARLIQRDLALPTTPGPQMHAQKRIFPNPTMSC